MACTYVSMQKTSFDHVRGWSAEANARQKQLLKEHFEELGNEEESEEEEDDREGDASSMDELLDDDHLHRQVCERLSTHQNHTTSKYCQHGTHPGCGKPCRAVVLFLINKAQYGVCGMCLMHAACVHTEAASGGWRRSGGQWQGQGAAAVRGKRRGSCDGFQGAGVSGGPAVSAARRAPGCCR